MNRTKKKRIKQILICVCIVTVVAFLAAMPLIAKQKPAEDGTKVTILSDTAQHGKINKELIGGGVLTEEAGVAISVPAAVKLKSFLVQNGDAVTAGTPVAEVDRVTVMKAISQVQETLEHLSEQIKEAGKTDGTETLTALAGGTVKILYAQEGDSVRDVMLEHGALAVLSMDGLLAADIITDSDTQVGKPVTVSLPDGKTVTGRVAKNLNGVMTVTIEDRSYNLGDMVGVRTAYDVYLGRGALYIYSPWNATAYTGTVGDIKVAVGDSLRTGDALMVLDNVGQTPAYRQLVSQRQEYEALMLELFRMYQSQTITAPCDGIVSGMDGNSLQMLSGGGGGYNLQLLANAPNGNDEMLYTNYVGKVTAVGSNGWSLLVNPQPVSVEDYADLTGVPVDAGTMTRVCTYPAEYDGSPQQPESEDTPVDGETPPTQPETVQTAPIYTLTDGVWQQIPYTAVTAGDILLFATDDSGEFVWIVRVSTGKDNSTPTEPSGTGGHPGGWGGMTGNTPSGGMTQPGFELYGMDMAQVAQVTPQNTMILEISVDELDINALQVGMHAQVAVGTLDSETYTATITAIDNIGTGNGGSSKFAVELTMDRTEDMLSGMNATATVTLSTVSDVLTVSADALVEKGNQTLVYTGYDGKNKKLTDPIVVTTGSSDGKIVEILEGLTLGQTYYYTYYDAPEISFTPDFKSGGSVFR